MNQLIHKHNHAKLSYHGSPSGISKAFSTRFARVFADVLDGDAAQAGFAAAMDYLVICAGCV